MSTTFRVLGPDDDKPDTPVLEVTEYSGKFDIAMWIYQHDPFNQCSHSFEVGDLTPQQLIKLGIRLIQIGLYTVPEDGPDTVRELLQELVY